MEISARLEHIMEKWSNTARIFTKIIWEYINLNRTDRLSANKLTADSLADGQLIADNSTSERSTADRNISDRLS